MTPMNMNRCITAAIVMTFACIVQAQDTLSGTWEGETRSGSSIVLTLAVKGTVLTGTMVRNGESTPLSEGQVAKNKFTFKVTMNDQAEGFSGELTGEEIKVWMDRQGAERAIVLRRAKRK
jgi:hypothetical protein